MKEANKAQRKLQSRKISLKNIGDGDLNKVEILFCTDATYASLKHEPSQGAYLVVYVVPVAWQSKKISRVTTSPPAFGNTGTE